MHRSPGHQNRRDVIRLLALSAVALPVTLRPRDAGATHGWCQRDPIFQIDGQTADLLLSSHLEMLTLASGPAQIVVTVPTGISTRLVATDPGFGGNGYDVRFAESNRLTDNPTILEVQIKVYAPALDDLSGLLPLTLPLRVTFTPRGKGRLVAGEVTGEANSWVTLRTP